MTEEKTLKEQATDIMTAIDRELQESDPTVTATDSRTNALVKTIFNIVSDVDMEEAADRVAQLREKYPDASPEELSQKLIRAKCQKTGTVGAVTSGTGVIPGLGTATALTLGVAADLGATFKLQAELVLELAAVYDYPLTEQEKQQLVMMITGLSVGTSALTRRAGQSAAIRLGEKVAEKSLEKALPIIGVIASAGTNALSTYIIGQRADAYFRLGPEAMGHWTDSLRAITGMDERKLGQWLAESGKATGEVLAAGAVKVGEAGQVAGGVIADGATKAKAGYLAYLGAVWALWKRVFRFIGQLFGWMWAVITFVPRKIWGWFRR